MKELDCFPVEEQVKYVLEYVKNTDAFKKYMKENHSYVLNNDFKVDDIIIFKNKYYVIKELIFGNKVDALRVFIDYDRIYAYGDRYNYDPCLVGIETISLEACKKTECITLKRIECKDYFNNGKKKKSNVIKIISDLNYDEFLKIYKKEDIISVKDEKKYLKDIKIYKTTSPTCLGYDYRG